MANVAFSVFDGDLKAGGDGPCTDENLYTPALAYSRSSRSRWCGSPATTIGPVLGPLRAGTSAPGTDDPIERLQHERALFASTDQMVKRNR